MTKNNIASNHIEELAQELSDAAIKLLRYREAIRNHGNDADMAPFRSAMDDPVHDDLRCRIKSIGSRAYDCDGTRAMIDVFDRAHDIILGKYSSRDAELAGIAIDHIWNRVGDWVC